MYSRRQMIGHLLLDHVTRLGRDSAPMKYQIMILLPKQDLNNDNTSWQETWKEDISWRGIPKRRAAGNQCQLRERDKAFLKDTHSDNLPSSKCSA